LAGQHGDGRYIVVNLNEGGKVRGVLIHTGSAPQRQSVIGPTTTCMTASQVPLPVIIAT